MRKVLIGVGIACLVLVGVGVVAVLRLDPQDLVALVEARVQSATGRSLKIEGKIGYSISLLPTVAAEGIRLQNAPWGSRPDMLTAKRVEIQVALLPLVSGNVQIRALTLIEPDVLLEVGRDGAKNWDFTPSDKAPAPQGAPARQPLEIRKARIENGTIAYRSAQPKRETLIGLRRIEFSLGAREAALEGQAAVNSIPVDIDAKVDHGGGLGTPGASGKAQVALSAPGVKLAGNGAVPLAAGDLAGLDLKLDAEVSDWATWAKLTGGEPRTLPPLKAQGVARAKADALMVEELKASVGKSSAAGSLRVGLGEKASAIDAKLDAPFVDLAELLGPPKPKKARPDGRVFSAEPFELAALRGLTGKLDVNIAKLALRDGKSLDGVHAQVSATHGRIVADPIRIRVEGREVRVRLTADASSGKALGVNLGVDAQGISLGAIAAMFNVAGAPEGSPTDVSIRLAGAGNSVRNLMAGANGDVRIVIGPGRVKNRAIDWGADVTELLNAINPARKAEPYTEIRCAAIRLPIRQGVARIDNSIGIETAKVNVLVGGVVDLRSETLDLGFRPKATTGLGVGLGSLAGLGRLRGSISDPKVEIDAAGAATAATQLGLAAATGGLSLIASALLSDSVPERPCQAALSGTAQSQQAGGAQKPGVVDEVVGGIKKLFGR